MSRKLRKVLTRAVALSSFIVVSSLLSGCIGQNFVESSSLIGSHKNSKSYLRVTRAIKVQEKSIFGASQSVIFPAGRYGLRKQYGSNPIEYYFESPAGVKWKSVIGTHRTPGRFLVILKNNKIYNIKGIYDDSGGGNLAPIPKSYYRYIQLKGK